MKPNFLIFNLVIIFIFSSLSTNAQVNIEKGYNCFSILIGKNATTDGSVMLAHNEDDSGEKVVNWYRVASENNNEIKDSITLKRGLKIAQENQRNSYLWLEIPELEFSDSYFNEYGVIITSNACKSREDIPELNGGGIGYWFRRLIIEKAKTAKEAVKIGGKLIEKIGYASSGRTYSIADANETWMLSVVNGKHWVAQRVKDNHIAIIPNYYTITNINLADTLNFLASADIIEYAIKRKWYNPETDGKFNFRKAYSDKENLQALVNKARHWTAINALSVKQYDINDEFPFSFEPKKKLELQDIYKVLRNHYENTDLDKSEAYTKGNPHHQKTMSVCSNTNQYGFVAQLRDWMPVEIGAVLWIAPRRPCTEAFIPIYSSMLTIPENFAVTDYKTALKNHFNKISDFEKYSKNHKYSYFNKKVKEIDNDYGKMIGNVKKSIEKKENSLISKQASFEKKLIKLYKNNPNQAIKKLTDYSLKHIF